jgi:DNA-binding transcriptional MerR regulator
MPRSTSQRLTRKLMRALADRIKAGAFAHVAAESLGVSPQQLKHWEKLGGARDVPRPLYREFSQTVRAARAHARMMAEMDMRTDQPRYWLLHGPGRETPTSPGWTAPVKRTDPDQPDLAGEIAEVCQRVLRALTDYPEIRARVAEALGDSQRDEE